MTDLSASLLGLTSARTDHELWDKHSVLMASYGFDRLLYGYTRYRTSTGLGDPQDWVMLATHDPGYMETFISERYLYDAPMVRWALENSGACSWRWMEEMQRADMLTEGEKRTIAFNLSHGVTAGYTISFRSLSERIRGAIALTAKAGVSQDAVEKVWAEHGDDILLANNVMHMKLLTLPYSGARPLTKRQREVLQWVGDGKTTQDIAVLLELRPRRWRSTCALRARPWTSRRQRKRF